MFLVHSAVSSLCAEPQPGQLPSLAAANPEAYTALIDCCLRMPVLPPDCMLVPGPLLLYALLAILESQAALDNTAAVAGLASALTSLVKRTVQLIRAAVDLQSESQPAAPVSSEANAAAAYSPAAAASIIIESVARTSRLLTGWFGRFQTAAANAGNAVGSSSNSSSQAAASAVLLAVMFARSLVQVADAIEAARPEVYLKSVLGEPGFRMRWVNDAAAAGAMFYDQQVHPYGTEDQHNADAQWQGWQLRVVQVMQDLWAAFKSISIAPSDAGAGEPAAAASAASAASSSAAAAAGEALAGDIGEEPQERSTSSSMGSTGSSDQQVKWGYLLHLQQCSPQLAAAVAAYEANQPNWEEAEVGDLPRTAAAAAQHSQHLQKQ
jgi:hypothetical protein